MVETDLKALCARSREMHPDVLLAADLFAGAGGLSLGLEQAGMRVVLGADHDPEALETHRHHFGGMAIDWDLGQAEVVERVADILKENRIEVLAGGPPCQPFSKAGRSGMRHLVRHGLRDPHDHRRDLWRSFLEIARLAEPSVVIMENVPDMALDREMFILRSMVFELESLGYSVSVRVLAAWRYGVPQFRQRLVLVAMKAGVGFEWPRETERKVSLGNAISDLPPVEGGWRPEGGASGWAAYEGPRTAFQSDMRLRVPKGDEGKVFDHITRPVREDDEQAFELLDSESRYSDLPEHLKRYRDDIFDDKYKRLSGDDLSRTITAHIAKDGYWYIHPEQNRTLTIREAARIQTFPDWYRFAGPPSAAFRQIGNAVPPRLGMAVGAAVIDALERKTESRPTSGQIADSLASWFHSPHESSAPWFRTNSAWQVMVGELLLDRVSPLVAESVWSVLAGLTAPGEFLRNHEVVAEALSWIGRDDRLANVRRLAIELESVSNITDETIEKLVEEGLLPRTIADLAQLCGLDGEEPVIVTSGAVRAATRFHNNQLGRMNQRTDGRIAIAGLVGFGDTARTAQLALLEIGTDVCTPQSPKCSECPLSTWCQSSELSL